MVLRHSDRLVVIDRPLLGREGRDAAVLAKRKVFHQADGHKPANYHNWAIIEALVGLASRHAHLHCALLLLPHFADAEDVVLVPGEGPARGLQTDHRPANYRDSWAIKRPARQGRRLQLSEWIPQAYYSEDGSREAPDDQMLPFGPLHGWYLGLLEEWTDKVVH